MSGSREGIGALAAFAQRMRFEIHWRAAPRYLAIGFGLLAYAYLIDHMLTLTIEQQEPELSSADDAQHEQLSDSLN